MRIMVTVFNGAFMMILMYVLLSIHETGRYLFPGTGNITERGNGEGYGLLLISRLMHLQKMSHF